MQEAKRSKIRKIRKPVCGRIAPEEIPERLLLCWSHQLCIIEVSEPIDCPPPGLPFLGTGPLQQPVSCFGDLGYDLWRNIFSFGYTPGWEVLHRIWPASSGPDQWVDEVPEQRRSNK